MMHVNVVVSNIVCEAIRHGKVNDADGIERLTSFLLRVLNGDRVLSVSQGQMLTDDQITSLAREKWAAMELPAEEHRRRAAEQAASERGEICKAIQPEIMPSQPLSAPFPPTADSGDSIYDPIAATAKLPPFDDLLQSMWVEEHSARKIDSQTVVISSVHYADFLAMRDQLMAINELAKHGNVDIDSIDRRVTMTSANSLKTIKAEPTETMTSAAQRLLGLIECEMVF